MLYINGELVDSIQKQDSVILNSSPILLGTATEISDRTRYFYGMIDELRIYDKALSKEEIVLFLKLD